MEKCRKVGKVTKSPPKLKTYHKDTFPSQLWLTENFAAFLKDWCAEFSGHSISRFKSDFVSHAPFSKACLLDRSLWAYSPFLIHADRVYKILTVSSTLAQIISSAVIIVQPPCALTHLNAKTLLRNYFESFWHYSDNEISESLQTIRKLPIVFQFLHKFDSILTASDKFTSFYISSSHFSPLNISSDNYFT